MIDLLFSIGKCFVRDMVEENNRGKFKSGGDKLVVH